MGEYKAWVIIAIIAVLLVVGAGLNIYFEVRGSGSGDNEKADSTSPETVETNATSPETVETDVKMLSVPTGVRDRIAYLGNGDIYVVEMNGTGEKKLTNRGDIWNFEVSPNGNWIAFVACPEDRNIIFKMRSDGTQVSQVTPPDKVVEPYPAFDPTSQYIYYFSKLGQQSQSDTIESTDTYAFDLERYNIETTSVDHVYTLYLNEFQDLAELWADPKGGALYCNIMGTDFPSGEPHKIILGQQVTDSVYMPREKIEDTLVVYNLNGLSMDGTYVSYFKWTLQLSPGRSGGPDEYTCYREASGYDEKVVVTETDFHFMPPEYSGLEFSAVSDNTYYYSKVRDSETINDTTLTFFSGTTADSSPKETGLILFIPSPGTWHLLATE